MNQGWQDVTCQLYVEKIKISRANKPNLPVANTTDGGVHVGIELRLARTVALLTLGPSLYKGIIMQTDLEANTPLYFHLPPLTVAFMEIGFSVGGRVMARGKCPQILMLTN